MPADSHSGLVVFTRVVALGNLSAAARELGVSASAVTKRIAGLEQRLGVRLLHRNARACSLTAEGELFYERCKVILTEIAEAEELVSAGRARPRGDLRITAPYAFGRRWVAPVAAAFHAAHPETRICLTLSDSVMDLVANGLDLAIRIGRPEHATLIARRIAVNRRVICAAPAYLARAGRPSTPADLARHRCLIFNRNGVRSDLWCFEDAGGTSHSVRVPEALSSDSGEVLHDWALAGAGLVMKSLWDVADDIRAGRLVPVLADWQLPAADIYAVYASRRQLASRTSLFIESLSDRLRASCTGLITANPEKRPSAGERTPGAAGNLLLEPRIRPD